MNGNSWNGVNRDGTRSTVTATTQREAIIKAEREAANRGTTLRQISR